MVGDEIASFALDPASPQAALKYAMGIGFGLGIRSPGDAKYHSAK